ncbi:MAG: hypothetical protein RR273_04385 [Oscillospiraceae bacterium]
MRDNIARKPRATADPVITVSTIFAGKQTDQEAFIDLIAKKAAKIALHNNQDIVDNTQTTKYTVSSSEKQNTRNGGQND